MNKNNVQNYKFLYNNQSISHFRQKTRNTKIQKSAMSQASIDYRDALESDKKDMEKLRK